MKTTFFLLVLFALLTQCSSENTRPKRHNHETVGRDASKIDAINPRQDYWEYYAEALLYGNSYSQAAFTFTVPDYPSSSDDGSEWFLLYTGYTTSGDSVLIFELYGFYGEMFLFTEYYFDGDYNYFELYAYPGEAVYVNMSEISGGTWNFLMTVDGTPYNLAAPTADSPFYYMFFSLRSLWRRY